MTVVFVHGNPECSAIWGPLLAELGRDDVVLLSPPGFGAPLPPDFPATTAGYGDWLAAELSALGEPVDLVGHDWGGGHTVNVAMRRPELLRSWVSDVLGVFDPEYVWHDMAQVLQTPGAGEQLTETLATAGPEAFLAMGMPADVAAAMADAQGPEMGRAMLALYRSAAQPAVAEAGVELPRAAARPGLSVLATEDHYVGTDEMRRRAAERAGAGTEVLDGLGHWWMLQDPARAAEMLTRFWATLD